MLLNKYKPKYLKDILGQDNAISKLRKAVNEKKAVLIYGPPGIGKSSSVYALAKELNYEIMEINGSDYRNKDQINEKVGNSAKQKSLFSKGKIILIDEIDGLNRSDRGAVAEIVKILKKTGHPIVIIGNEINNSKFKDLRRICSIVHFEKLNYLDILRVLKDILIKENIKSEGMDLKKLAINSKGDVRGAINDLELLMISKDEIDERDKKENISKVMEFIFKTKDQNEILKRVNLLDENLDDILMWLEENIPYEYQNVKSAYDYLSKADVFRGRIRKWQYWRFLVYQNFLMNLGVAFSKDRINKNLINYKRNSRILKIWINNRRTNVRKEMAEKLSKDLHMSKNKFMKEFDYMKFLH